MELNPSTAWLIQYIKNFGFPRLVRFLKNIVKPLQIEALKYALPKINNLDPEYFAHLIEISSAYQRSGLNDKLTEVLGENTKKKIEVRELIKILGKEFLNQFSQRLGIKTQIREEAFNTWNLEYLPRLFTYEDFFSRKKFSTKFIQ